MSPFTFLCVEWPYNISLGHQKSLRIKTDKSKNHTKTKQPVISQDHLSKPSHMWTWFIGGVFLDNLAKCFWQPNKIALLNPYADIVQF